MAHFLRYPLTWYKNLNVRGCLVCIGLGLIFMGCTILLNRSLGTEHFMNTDFDLKDVAIPASILGYILVTMFSTHLKIMPIIGFFAVMLLMFIGSFGGGSMGSWGWTVGFVTILAIAPIAVLLCITTGIVSLIKIIGKEPSTKVPIGISAAIVLFCYVGLIALINIGPNLNPALAALKSKDKTARILAAQSLADLGDKRAIDPLIEMLSDPNAEIRAAAATGLGSFILAGMNSDTRAIKPLIQSLQDESAPVRAASARSLGRITEHLRSEAAKWPIEPLTHALKDEDISVREAAAKSLSMMGHK